jgi:hypothetical protein
MKEGDNLHINRRIILKRVLNKYSEDWIKLAQNVMERRVLVNKIINFRIPQKAIEILD